MMKVYLAADYARKAEVRGLADRLEAMGVRCTSTWCRVGDDAEGGVGLTADEPGWAHQMADMDLRDVVNSDALVQLTTGEHARGGRHVEMGIAMGVGLKVFAVGPRETVFHWHRDVTVVPSWEDLVPLLQAVRPWFEADGGGGPPLF